jgi:acetyl esterase/lipase
MDVAEVMTRVFQVFAVLLIVCGLAYNYAALEIFNFLVPKDSGTTLVASNIKYGPSERQRFDLYRPEGSVDKLPVLIFVHGGGWDSGSGEPYEFVARAFASKGYLTATMSYRLVPQNLFPDFVEDVALAIRQVRADADQYGGDPERIFLVGHSAGGYCILQSVLDPAYFAKAGISIDNIKGVATLAAPADFFPYDAKKSIAAFSHHPVPMETQPVTFARGDAPPILLLHGTADTTVRPFNSQSLSKKLREQGGTVQHTEYEDVGHVAIMLSLAKPMRNRLPVFSDILTFFDRYK